MIACRRFARIDRTWGSLHNAPARRKSPSLFQAYHTFSCLLKVYEAMTGSNTLGRPKKRKVAIPMWKAVSTASGNIEDKKASEGWQVHEMLHAPSSCSSVKKLTQDEHVAGFMASSAISIDDTEKGKGSGSLEKKPTTSYKYEAENCLEGVCSSMSSENLPQEIVMEIRPDLGFGGKAKTANVVNKHSQIVQVDASLIRFVKGKWGSTQKQIEEEMGVNIIFPASREETTLVVEGSSIESVTKASEKIETIVEQAVNSPGLDYSHFISLPLAIHTELVEKLQDFQNSILDNTTLDQEANMEIESDEDYPDDMKGEKKELGIPKVTVEFEVQDKKQVKVKIGTSGISNVNTESLRDSTLSALGIDKSIFIKPKTFHLTVLMLKLWNKERVAAASEVLQGLSSRVMAALDNRPVSIRLKGLECMRGSLTKARVVYAPVEEIGGEGRLLRVCQVIVNAYVEAGLVLEKDAQQPLKLHATLMNVRHRKSKDRGRRNDSFDARNIFLRFGSEEWGSYLIKEAHLSQRFLFCESGYYRSCGIIAFPENIKDE